jgi:hypothetical protein
LCRIARLVPDIRLHNRGSFDPAILSYPMRTAHALRRRRNLCKALSSHVPLLSIHHWNSRLGKNLGPANPCATMLWISMLEFREGAHSLMRMNFPALETEFALATFHGRRWGGCERERERERERCGREGVMGGLYRRKVAGGRLTPVDQT